MPNKPPAKPRIAIPIPTAADETYNDSAWPLFARAVESSGGEPVAVRLDATPEEIARLAGTCAGVLLPGSPADVNPEKYGAARIPATATPDPRRELVDELLLQDAQNMRKPIFGVCYGVQSLNVWSGGTLIQDLPEKPVLHPAGRRVARAHTLQIEPNSRLAAATAVAHARAPSKDHVNSSHHQAIAVVGDGLRVTARSEPDDVIEAVEGTRPGQFVLGTQWHPERGFEADPLSRELFRQFIAAAQSWRPRTSE